MNTEIREVLEDPGTIYPSADDDTVSVILGTTCAGRRLKVVVRTDDPGFVISVADRDDER